ncbi:MAG TPA: hypothetical protein VF159_13150 [Gemmatimonadaceae bacterium]
MPDLTERRDSTLHVATFATQAFVVTARPELAGEGGRWWWVRIDDAWYRVGPRRSGELTARTLVAEWLATNLRPAAELDAAGCGGPASWATPENPLVIDVDGSRFTCHVSGAAQTDRERPAAGDRSWIVEFGTVAMCLPLDAGDSAVSVRWKIVGAVLPFPSI